MNAVIVVVYNDKQVEGIWINYNPHEYLQICPDVMENFFLRNWYFYVVKSLEKYIFFSKTIKRKMKTTWRTFCVEYRMYFLISTILKEGLCDDKKLHHLYYVRIPKSKYNLIYLLTFYFINFYLERQKGTYKSKKRHVF